VPDESLIEAFSTLAKAGAASVEVVGRRDTIASSARRYLDRERLPPDVVLAPALQHEIDWAAAGIKAAVRPVERDGETAVTGCYAGVAGEGALVMLSSAGQPAELSFLPATHIVILPAEDLVADLEALWARLRAQFQGIMPRTMNFIVGPSRTADLGVPSKLGAHGPARVHIIIVSEGEPVA